MEGRLRRGRRMTLTDKEKIKRILEK